MAVSILLIGVLLALAAIHAYWACGGRWPGHDEASLVERVVGRTSGMRAPSPASCIVVAAALASSAGLVFFKTFAVAPEAFEVLVAIGFWGAALVFLVRGVAGFTPAFRYAEETPFYRLNRRYYSPLCLLMAAAFVAASW